MKSKTNHYYLSYIIITIGLLISGYLLLNHYALNTGKPLESNLCMAIFGKGCDAAALSNASQFLKIPVAGWGIIYFVVIGCFLLMSQIFYTNKKKETTQVAFWFSFLGIIFSTYFLVLMLINPALFCPFCVVFHLLNISLFIIIKKITKQSFSELFKGLLKALGIVFLAATVTYKFNKWKWLTIILPLLFGFVTYQWIIMQGLTITNKKLNSYDPLIEIEKFEARQVWEIPLLSSDPILGYEDAPVTLVVFSDFQCSTCAMFATNFEYLIAYNQGKLKIVFKHFPLSSSCNSLAIYDLHPLACNAARASHAAQQQGQFWEYHNLLFQNEINNQEVLFGMAKSLGLNMEQFNADYNSAASINKISQDVDEGLRLMVNGTPTAFLNGREVSDLSQDNINYLVKFLAH